MSSLFANQRETNLASTVVLVGEVLDELGHSSLAEERIKDPAALHAWQIRKGSAVIRVALLHRTEFTHLRVSAIVMTLDDKVDRLALYSHLLELNANLCGAAFAIESPGSTPQGSAASISNAHVLIVGERSTLDLDRSEVKDTIERITTYADEHDDILVARFGGTLGARA